MRVIDLGKKSPHQRVTVMSYGGMRSGKTRFAATFPRPLFLSDNTESGWTTIEHMDPAAFFEPERRPVVWAIERGPDMMQCIAEMENVLRNEPGKFLTVVVDSLTFYADLFFNAIDGAARIGGRQPDNRILYSNLAAHLRELRIRIHSLNINVVWLCLEKQATADEPVGGPMLSGQNAQKFAAGCDYIFYHRSYQTNPSTPLQWDVRTRRFNQYPAGGRDEGLVHDPLGFIEEVEEAGEVKQVFVPDCTYRTLALSLGITDKVALTAPPPPALLTPIMKPASGPQPQVQVQPSPGTGRGGASRPAISTAGTAQPGKAVTPSRT